jgi:autotransporter-associated beta strand protein
MSTLSSEGGDGGSGIVIARYLGATASSGGNTLAAGNGLAAGYTVQTFTSSGTLTLNAIAPVLSGNITGTGNLTVEATGGTIALTGTNAYVNTTISGGTLNLGNNTTAGILGSGTVTNNAALVLQRSNDFTVANNIGGTGALTKAGAGVATLTGDNAYTGVTTISAGTLSVATIGNGGVAGNLGQATNAAANLVLSGGTLQYTGDSASTDRNFTLTAGTTSTINVSTAASTLTMSGASTATTGALTKSGDGTLTLTGNHTYTGRTTVSTGTLRFAPSTTFDMRLHGGMINNANVIFDGTTGGNIGGATFITDASGSGTWSVTGTTSGRGAYNNRLILIGNTTISGLVTVTNFGNFWLEGTAINTTAPIFLDGPNTYFNIYNLGNTVMNIGALSGNGRVETRGSGVLTLSLGNGNGSATLAVFLQMRRGFC